MPSKQIKELPNKPVSVSGDDTLIIQDINNINYQVPVSDIKNNITGRFDSRINVSIDNIQQYSVLVNISVPLDITPINYKLLYYAVGEGANGVTLEKTITNNSLTLDSLLPNMMYRLKVIIEDTNNNLYSSQSDIGFKTFPDTGIFNPNKYSVANVLGVDREILVTSLEDNNNIGIYNPVTDTSSNLTNINKGIEYDGSASVLSNSIIQCDFPITAKGKGGTGTGSNGGLQPVFTSGSNFSFFRNRSNDQHLRIFAVEDSRCELYQQGNLLATFNISANTVYDHSWTQTPINNTQIYHLVFLKGSGMCSVYSAGNLTDVHALFPASLQMYGVPSGQFIITALEDNTTVTAYYTNGTTDTQTINKNTYIRYATTGNLYTGAGVLFVADKPVNGASLADGDGGCAAPGTGLNYLNSEVARTGNFDWVAFMYNDNVNIEAYNSDGTLAGTITPVGHDYGGDIGKVYKAYSTDPVILSARIFKRSDNKGFAAWYQNLETDDETSWTGRRYTI